MPENDQVTVIRVCPEFKFDAANFSFFSYGLNTFMAFGGDGNSNNLYNWIGGSSTSFNFVEFNLENAIGAHQLRCFKSRMALPYRGLKRLASAHHVRFQTHPLGETTTEGKS